MTDWADGIEIRNNGIKCVIDPRIMSDLLRTIISLGLIAGALLFYSWVRSQIVYTGYESQELFAAEEKLLHIQKKLILEEETLKNPKRIDIIARNDLGMTPLRPNQLILPPSQAGGSGIPDSMAMAGSEANDIPEPAESRRFGNYFIN